MPTQFPVPTLLLYLQISLPVLGFRMRERNVYLWRWDSNPGPCEYNVLTLSLLSYNPPPTPPAQRTHFFSIIFPLPVTMQHSLDC